MELIFARHGESEANLQRIISNRALPHALTERGRQQAATLARQLAGRPITALYTSPIPRAQETAAILGAALGVAPVVADALREWDCGEWEGRGDDAAWQAHAQAVAAWAAGDADYCLAGGESLNVMRARFVPFVESLVARPTRGSVVLLAHGSLLQHMLPGLLANVDQAWADQHGLQPATYVSAQLVGGRLLCVEWAGTPLDALRER